MGDHYDTAYMEDVYDADTGGDGLRAAAQGADDNHSATTALLLAAEQLLRARRAPASSSATSGWSTSPARSSRPTASAPARSASRLVEGHAGVHRRGWQQARRLEGASRRRLRARHDRPQHRPRPRRVPDRAGRGRRVDAARAARTARDRSAGTRSRVEPRRPASARKRMPDGSEPPPPFAHLPLHGEVRVEWEPRSALYNTDGQVFSDVGIPVVLFMENYDIIRKGYHDTHDTMENIDLDYCAALTAIAIETVCRGRVARHRCSLRRRVRLEHDDATAAAVDRSVIRGPADRAHLQLPRRGLARPPRSRRARAARQGARRARR